jgi:hypothetical protein
MPKECAYPKRVSIKNMIIAGHNAGPGGQQKSGA